MCYMIKVFSYHNLTYGLHMLDREAARRITFSFLETILIFSGGSIFNIYVSAEIHHTT